MQNERIVRNDQDRVKISISYKHLVPYSTNVVMALV